MLRRTFCHIPGIGRETEKNLWAQGCSDWDTFLQNPAEFNLGTADRDQTARLVEQSLEALAHRNHQFFQLRLGHNEAWRAWPEFRSHCLYLDIETDGGRRGDAVTLIGLYDGQEFTGLVKGRDLERFHDLISEANMIVTFFGLGFDVPMLQKRFKSVPFDQIHLDLCATLKRIGFRGGLKKIEKQLGWDRGEGIDGLTGLDAIRLWTEYCRGRADSLDKLIAYNREDVVNLEKLAQIAYDQLSALTLGLPQPEIPGLIEPLIAPSPSLRSPTGSFKKRSSGTRTGIPKR